MPNYLIGYDVGSSSIKVSIVNADTLERITSAQSPMAEMSIASEHKGWAEQNPDDWWKHVCEGTKIAISQSKIKPQKIVGIGISYQMHGLVIVDKKGYPLRNAIIWCDSRAVEIGDKTYDALGDYYCKENLLNAPGNFTASKLRWVIENDKNAYQKAYKFMLPGDYIAYKLTGKMNTTIGGLSEGIFWDFKEYAISNKLFGLLEINQSLVPDLVTNFTIQGSVSSRASIECGLAEGTPVNYRAGDQPNNALSLNVFNSGELALSGGTSGVIYALTQSKKSSELKKINAFAHVNYSKNHQLIGKLLCINGCGILYKWLKENFHEVSYEFMNQKAAEVPIGADGLIVYPFGNGAERMFQNKTLNAHFANIDFNRHSNAHIYRAALEGIAFAFVYGFELLKKDEVNIDLMRTGNENLFRSEILATTIATLTNTNIEIYNSNGSVGAARAAGIKNDNFEDYKKLVSQQDYLKTIQPDQISKPYKRAYKKWRNQLDVIIKQ
jgi:xylulokinase